MAAVRASMSHQVEIELKRNCEASLIPSGVKVEIQAGTVVYIQQALGNSYTVYVNGNLVRIAGKDGDALGLVVMEEPDVNLLPLNLEEKVLTQLKTAYDPEIPVNIVDLGLVYACEILPKGKKTYGVLIKMTLTAPGCGMGPTLINDIEEKIRQIKGIIEVKVELVFDPPWDRDRMSDEAKLQLGLL